jgi:hypothetical protein
LQETRKVEPLAIAGYRNKARHGAKDPESSFATLSRAQAKTNRIRQLLDWAVLRHSEGNLRGTHGTELLGVQLLAGEKRSVTVHIPNDVGALRRNAGVSQPNTRCIRRRAFLDRRSIEETGLNS